MGVTSVTAAAERHAAHTRRHTGDGAVSLTRGRRATPAPADNCAAPERRERRARSEGLLQSARRGAGTSERSKQGRLSPARQLGPLTHHGAYRVASHTARHPPPQQRRRHTGQDVSIAPSSSSPPPSAYLRQTGERRGPHGHGVVGAALAAPPLSPPPPPAGVTPAGCRQLGVTPLPRPTPPPPPARPLGAQKGPAGRSPGRCSERTVDVGQAGGQGAAGRGLPMCDRRT